MGAMAWDAAGPEDHGVTDKTPIFGKGSSWLPTFKLKKKRNVAESEKTQQDMS
jgi:hypothetical protein